MVEKPDFCRSKSSCGDFAYTDIKIGSIEEDRMGVSHAIGRKKRRIKDTFAARNLQPRKKSTDVIVEQRTSEKWLQVRTQPNYTCEKKRSIQGAKDFMRSFGAVWKKK